MYLMFAIDALVLYRGSDSSASCEKHCNQTEDVAKFQPLIPIPGVVIKKIKAHYFRCYLYELGNSENANHLDLSIVDIQCHGRMLLQVFKRSFKYSSIHVISPSINDR